MAPLQTATRTADLQVHGLDGGTATRGVCSALKCIRGVRDVGVEPRMHHITVTYDAHRVSPRQFATAVRVMGCEVERLTIRQPEAVPADPIDGVQSFPSAAVHTNSHQD